MPVMMPNMMLSWFVLAFVSALLAHITLSRERAAQVSGIPLLMGTMCGVMSGAVGSALTGERLGDPHPVGFTLGFMGAFAGAAASLSLRAAMRRSHQLAEARTSASSAIVVASSCVSTGLHR